MKRSVYYFSGLLFWVLFTIPTIFVSCKSEKDEPEVNRYVVIDPSIISGDWIIENYIGEDGEVRDFNIEFSILPFQIIDEPSNSSDTPNKLWSKIYYNITEKKNDLGVEYGDAMFDFFKIGGDSKIYIIGMMLDIGESLFISLGEMKYAENILISNRAVYTFSSSAGQTETSDVGIIRMRKL